MWQTKWLAQLAQTSNFAKSHDLMSINKIFKLTVNYTVANNDTSFFLFQILQSNFRNSDLFLIFRLIVQIWKHYLVSTELNSVLHKNHSVSVGMIA